MKIHRVLLGIVAVLILAYLLQAAVFPVFKAQAQTSIGTGELVTLGAQGPAFQPTTLSIPGRSTARDTETAATSCEITRCR